MAEQSNALVLKTTKVFGRERLIKEGKGIGNKKHQMLRLFVKMPSIDKSVEQAGS